MSLYNLVNGCTSAVFFVMPMLGEVHPDEYPRFRDCFLSDPDHPEYDNHIHVYTRVGGRNRADYDCSRMFSHPDFVTTFDDSYDSTYGSYVFRVPAEWKEDFDKFLAGEVAGFSPAYQARCRAVFPKLKEQFDILWGASEAA